VLHTAPSLPSLFLRLGIYISVVLVFYKKKETMREGGWPWNKYNARVPHEMNTQVRHEINVIQSGKLIR
jgi:hypothetical protein